MHKTSIGQLLRYYFRRAWVIILVSAVGAFGGWFYSSELVQPQYISESTVILNQHESSNVKLINNYIALLKSRKILEPIIQNNNMTVDYSELAENISIVNEESTEVIAISVTASSPELAQVINAELISKFNLEDLGLGDTEKHKESNEIATVIDPASRDDRPVNIKTAQVMAIAAGIAAVVAITALFIIFDYKQERRYSAKSFTSRRRSVIGSVTTEQGQYIDVKNTTSNRGDELPNKAIPLIRQEACDILDVLENLNGNNLSGLGGGYAGK